MLRRMMRDRRGSVLVLGTFGILLTGAISMFATDLARVQVARARIQGAADAAMLAAARDLGAPEATLRAVAQQVFDANLSGAPGDLAVTRLEMIFTAGRPGDDPDTIRLEVDARLPLMMARLADAIRLTDLTRADLSIVSAARKRVMGAEVMMVLDNTGSMASPAGQPIKDLRAAARVLADTLFDNRESVPNVYVGLVNYSATVNIGRQHAGWLDRTLAQVDAEFAPTPWKGCVRVRSTALAETDAPPVAAALFTPQFWPSSRLSFTPLEYDIYYTNDKKSPKKDKNLWPPEKTVNGVVVQDTGKPYVDERQSAGNNGYGPNLGCPGPITPLISSRQAILDAIDGTNGAQRVDAWSRGGTFGNVGLAWGWRTLSPRWRGLWRYRDGTVNPALPLDYDTPFHNKIIVMMTDGVNQHYQTDMTAYGRPNEMIAKSEVDPSMLRLCQNIKDAGIIVFTITFGGSVNQNTRDTYTSCASDAATEERIVGQKYFHAPTGAQLKTVFATIGGQIQELRLVN